MFDQLFDLSRCGRHHFIYVVCRNVFSYGQVFSKLFMNDNYNWKVSVYDIFNIISIMMFNIMSRLLLLILMLFFESILETSAAIETASVIAVRSSATVSTLGRSLFLSNSLFYIVTSCFA